jgi:hypothetical protein
MTKKFSDQRAKVEDAMVVINHLRENRDNEEQLIAHLKDLIVYIRNSDAKWLNTFIQCKGTVLLLQLFVQYNNK